MSKILEIMLKNFFISSKASLLLVSKILEAMAYVLSGKSLQTLFSLSTNSSEIFKISLEANRF